MNESNLLTAEWKHSSGVSDMTVRTKITINKRAGMQAQTCHHSDIKSRSFRIFSDDYGQS
jgi:hypothetical protein